MTCPTLGRSHTLRAGQPARKCLARPGFQGRGVCRAGEQVGPQGPPGTPRTWRLETHTGTSKPKRLPQTRGSGDPFLLYHRQPQAGHSREGGLALTTQASRGGINVPSGPAATAPSENQPLGWEKAQRHPTLPSGNRTRCHEHPALGAPSFLLLELGPG